MSINRIILNSIDGFAKVPVKKFLPEIPTITSQVLQSDASGVFSRAAANIARGLIAAKEVPQSVIARGMNRNAVNLARNVDGIADWAAENTDKYTFLYQAPLSGKAYLLDKVSTNKDGSVEVKIYDRAKKFVKSACLQPKKLTVIDSFMGNYVDVVAYKMTHGQLVEFYAKKNNPALIVDNYSIASKNGISAEEDFQTALNSVLKQIKKGRKIDAVCYSLEGPFSYSEFEELTGKDISKMTQQQQKQAICNAFSDIHLVRSDEDYKRVLSSNLLEDPNQKENLDYFLDVVNQNMKEADIINEISNGGTRVLVSSGNGGSSSFNPIFVLSKAESVGGLTRGGKILGQAEGASSASRKFTNHYEIGEYPIINMDGRVNISNSRTTDYTIGDEFTNFTQFIYGMKDNLLATEKQLQGVTDFEQLPEGFRKNAIFKLRDYYRLKHHTMSPEDFKFDLDKSYCYRGIVFSPDTSGSYDFYFSDLLRGTSFAAPARAAKILLYESLKGILE